VIPRHTATVDVDYCGGRDSLRIKSIMLRLLSVGLVVAGAGLIGLFFVGQGPGSIAADRVQPENQSTPNTTATDEPDPEGFNVPSVQQTAPQQTGGPEDKTLNVTIPQMSRIEDDTVPDAKGGDEEALKENGAIHLRGTGFPWQEGANTYLAGHRLGYPGTESFLTFYDLNSLENGDEVYVEDSEGTEYTYRVYKTFVTGPSDMSVTEPVAGKSVLTLQTCTLPDYRDRLIVRAELVEKSAA
jgi:sortase A